MSFAGKPSDKDLNKGRVAAAKVRRYRAGHVPHWLKEEQEEEQQQAAARAADDDEAEPVARTDVAAPVIVRRADDPRLARLAGQRRGGDVSSSDEEDEGAGGRRRPVAEPQIVRRRVREVSDEEEEEEAGPSEEEDEEEDEEALEQRRAAVREKLKQRQEEELLAGVQEEEEEEEDEEDSSEYETDSEDEEGGRLMKPVFVPKEERETIDEREALELEEEAQVARAKQRLQERKLETRELVVGIMQAEADAAKAGQVETMTAMDAVVTDDEACDEEAEFEAWKAREMQRIRRDREDREREVKEGAERERWDALSEHEKAREKAAMLAQSGKAKKKWGFLQKYWHKGAFFQEEADDVFGTTSTLDVLSRDYSAPTGEDRVDKSMLPKIMQVKNFGRRGRTKWTHLVDQDTTDYQADPWMQDDSQRAKYNSKMAGMGDVFEKPKHLKR